MTRLMIAALGLFLVAGCDFEVPLIEDPKTPVDERAVGLWEQTAPDGQTRRLLVLPLSENEYLVSYPAESRDSLYGKVTHCEVADIELVQFEWFGTGKGNTPDTEKIYQYGTYSVDGDTLEFRLLNRDAVDKDAATREELHESIAAQADNPELFRKPMVFRKIEE